MPPAPQPCRAGPPPPPISQRPRWIVVRRNNCAVQHAHPLGDGAAQHAYPPGHAAVQRKARRNPDAVQQNPLGTMRFRGHRAGSMGAGGIAPSGYCGAHWVTGEAPSGYSGTQWRRSSGFCGASVTSGFREEKTFYGRLFEKHIFSRISETYPSRLVHLSHPRASRTLWVALMGFQAPTPLPCRRSSILRGFGNFGTTHIEPLEYDDSVY